MPKALKEKKQHVCTQLKKNGTVCGKVYRDQPDLKRHTRTHTGKKPEICNEITNTETGETCGIGFSQPSALKRHIRTQHTHKGEKHHICLEIVKKTGKPCGIAFAELGHLTNHVNVVHKDIKNHVCEHVLEDGPRKGEVCGKRFGTKDNLHVHMIDHTGVFPFVCKRLKDEDGEVCDQGFKSNGLLAVHVMTNHTEKTSSAYLEYREKNNTRNRERYAIDVEYRLENLMRKSFNRFKNTRGGKTNTTSHAQVVVFCTWDELVVHLHDNPHGYTLDTEDIHINHIRPVSSFTLANDPIEKHRCMNFNNLQLLPGPENLAKSDYYNATEYALTDASKAIEKLVSGWVAMYYSG